jgi:hypothetical protein
MNRQPKKSITLTSESHSDLHAILKYFKGISPPTTMKTPEELEEIRTHAATLGDDDGACWFKNTTGGDYCVSYPADECVKRGGTPLPGKCPHFFAAVAAANRLSTTLSLRAKKGASKPKTGTPK